MAMDAGVLASSLHGRVVVLGEDVVLVVQGERSGVAVGDVGHLGGVSRSTTPKTVPG